MSAIPKRINERNWTKSQSVSTTLTGPRIWVPPVESPAPAVTREKKATGSQNIPRAIIKFLVRAEKSIWLISLIGLLIFVAMTSQSVVAAKNGIRDASYAIWDLKKEIGFVEKELEEVKRSLEGNNETGMSGTLPINSEDVAIVQLPPLR